MDGESRAELLFTPAIDRDIHALFNEQIADFDPLALHVIIQDQPGFHLPTDDPRLPKILRLLPLPPYNPEVRSNASAACSTPPAVSDRLDPNLRRLKDHLFAASKPWTRPAAVAGLIHSWLADQTNSGVPT